MRVRRVRLFRVRRARLVKDERGATAIIVVLSLVALVGMVVIAVDGGTLVMQRRRLVRTADAAAMAAALSFAYPNPPQSVCGVDEAVAKDKALQVAQANAADATWDPTLPVGIDGWFTDCDKHTVTVKFHAPAFLGFAPALGFDQNRFVSATATARWITGTPSAFFGVSMMLRASWLKQCTDATDPTKNLLDVAADPPQEPSVGTACGVWMNNRPTNDLLGDANWGMLNLVTQPYDGSSWGKWGWDVPDDYNCSAVDATYRSLWLEQGVNWDLGLYGVYPNHTYVCNVTGGSTSVIQTLEGQVGNIKQWPINCAGDSSTDPLWAATSPYCDGRGQVDTTGVLCPPENCPQPDKYDIIGFIPLRIDSVLYGNDPAAIGTLEQTGDCSKKQLFDQTRGPTTIHLDGQFGTFNGPDCPGTTTFDTLENYTNPSTGAQDPYHPYVFTKQGNNPPIESVACTDSSGTSPLGCDYYYDPAAHQITWMDWTVGGVCTDGISICVNPTIEFHWTKNATEGLCGTHASDPNAKCVMLSWQGEQQGGEGGEGTGYDFGTNGVALCPDPPDPCP